MSYNLTVTVHDILTDGLPDPGLAGRVAFVFDGQLISGMPTPQAALDALPEAARAGSYGEAIWTASPKAHPAVDSYTGVHHWIEFSEDIAGIESLTLARLTDA